MKKNILYVALAGMSLLFAGCNDDLGIDTPQAVEKHYGEEINFGGSASYNLAGKEGGSTRTVYGGYDNIADGKEPVYWVSTDQVRLFCNEAAVKTADYQVATSATDAKSEVTSTGLNKTGAAGLQWGDPKAAHTFYGAYPIPSDNSLTESTTLTGTIPAVQDYNTNEEIDSDGDGNYVFAPNMEYAHMVAKTVVNDPNNIGEQVFMKFTPIATAVEIELKNNAPTNDANDVVYNFREVHLSSDTHYLSGSFTANLDNMASLGGAETDAARYASGCPTGITYGDDKSKQVAVRLYDNGKAVSLTESKSLKFTVFMLPSSDGASDEDAVKDLKITLVTSEGNKTGTLNNIVIKKSKKTYMHTMPIGYEMTYNQAEWLKYVDGTKKLNTLSIPGAGGAASGKTGYGGSDNWEKDKLYLEQELDLSALWNVGIRCFEFTVDKHATTDGDIGSCIVYCNSKPCGSTTLAQAVGGVKQLLMKHPKEFAMIIVTYQENAGWNLSDGTTLTRDAEVFMKQLNAFWNKVSDGSNEDNDESTVYDNAWTGGTQTALYDPTKTLDEVRGSLFCIARPTSNDEDNKTIVNTKSTSASLTTFNEITSISSAEVSLELATNKPHEHILVINGWGALKDKWEARGYTSCVFHRGWGNDALNTAIARTDKDWKSIINYVTGGIGRPFDVNNSSGSFNTLADKDGDSNTNYVDENLSKLSPDFYYSTQTQTGITEKGAWVQEWARVSNSDETITATAPKKNWYQSTASTGTVYFMWPSSYNEKLKRVNECLDYSIAKKITYKGEETDASNTIFINSLCGYFIDRTVLTKDGNSYLPNCMTDFSGAWEDRNLIGADYFYHATMISGYSTYAGMSGNIEDFADDINKDFLEYLKTKLDEENRLAGSTGIVLMDRVSNTTGAGAEIPSIIIANNFAPDQNATGASTYQIATSNLDLEGGDNIAAPARRNSQPSITWGEWE